VRGKGGRLCFVRGALLFLAACAMNAGCTKSPPVSAALEPASPSSPSSPLEPVESLPLPESEVPGPPIQPASRCNSSGPSVQSFPVDGFEAAAVRIPEAAGKKKWRVAFAAHGAGGRGVDHCEYFDSRLASDVLLVCPAGTPLRRSEPDGGSYFENHFTLRSELRAVKEALLRDWAGCVKEKEWLYIGYSQGATMGALALVDEKSDAKLPFADLLLVEGGGENWNLARSLFFAKASGHRVRLVCGTPSCSRRGRAAVSALRKAKLHAELRAVPGGGHAYWGKMGDAITAEFEHLGYGTTR